MLSVRRSIAFCLLLLGAWPWLLGSPPDAFAADVIKFEVDFFESGSEDPINHATIWSTGRKIRVDQMQPGGGPSSPSLVYRGDQDLVISISDRTQSYVKVERRLLSLIEGRVRAGRRTVEGHLKALPGDQRKGLERLLGVSREDPNAVTNPIVVEPVSALVDRAGEIAGFACARKVMRRGTVVVGEACVAPWDKIGMTPADMEVFRSLANYQRDALGTRQVTPLEIVPDQPLDLIVQFGGIPLSFERTLGSQRRSAVRVTSVEWVANEASLFEPPTNYTLTTGYAGIISHLAQSDHRETAATPAKAETTATPLVDKSPAIAPAKEQIPRQPPAAMASSMDHGEQASAGSVRGRDFRASSNARRTVGATRDRKAAVRLFPNH